ncbi:hypothetical protein Tco_1050511 [Tanacetum coccineum]
MEGYGYDDVTFNPTQILSVHKWALKKIQPEEPHFTTHMLAIYNATELLVTKGGSSSKEAIGSQTSHSIKETQSSSTKDSNPSQPPSSTHVVDGIHKEALKATSSPTSLGVTSGVKANPQHISVVSASTINHVYSVSSILHAESASRHDALTYSIAEADPRKSAPNDSISQQQEKTKYVGDGLKTAHTITGSDKDTSNAKKEVKDVDVYFLDLDSLEDDEPIFVQDEEEEEVHAEEVHTKETPNFKLVNEKKEAETKADLLKAQLSFPNVEKLTELLLEEFQSSITRLTSHVANIKNLQLELPSEFHALPGDVSSIQVHISKVKTLDALLSLLNRVTEELDMFAHAIELACKKTRDHGVPSACKAGTHPAEGEKNT